MAGWILSKDNKIHLIHYHGIVTQCWTIPLNHAYMNFDFSWQADWTLKACKHISIYVYCDTGRNILLHILNTIQILKIYWKIYHFLIWTRVSYSRTHFVCFKSFMFKYFHGLTENLWILSSHTVLSSQYQTCLPLRTATSSRCHAWTHNLSLLLYTVGQKTDSCK